MASPIEVNITTKPVQLWSGRDPSVSTLLLMNTDLKNTVMTGSSLTSLVIPIAPNGSLSVDPSENWYAVGSTVGTAPLVVIPNGQGNFLGLTQGQGQLAIPSVQSPDFIHDVSGWTINQDGSAEFNDLTLRGTFMGTNYVINSTGIFFYSGTPAAGNLVIAIANQLNSDQFGNVYSAGITVQLDGQSGVVINSSGASTNISFPLFASGRPGQVFSTLLNQGAANQVTQVLVSSGQEEPVVNVFRDASALVLNSESADQSIPASVNIAIGLNNIATFSDGMMQLNSVTGLGTSTFVITNNGIIRFQSQDTNLYNAGPARFTAVNVPVSGSSFVLFKTFPVLAGVTYEIYARVCYIGNQNAGAPVIGWHGGTIGPGIPNASGYTQFGFVQNAVYNNSTAGDRTGPTLTTGAMIYESRFRFSVPASGTIGMAGGCTIPTDTWNATSVDIYLTTVA
jgi:hypothetical protein